MAKWGLRTKSLLALALACLLALIPAVFIGWHVFDSVREHFGRSYVEDLTQLNRQRVEALISRELALSLRLADSEILRRFLHNEDDPATRELFFREAEGYRGDLRSQSLFVASALSHHYYFSDKPQTEPQPPRYTLSPKQVEDGWFFSSMQSSEPYTINIDMDRGESQTRVWINAQVRDGSQVLGMVGSGMDLGGFLRRYVSSGDVGVTPLFVDASGAIQAYHDASRIAYNRVANVETPGSSVFGLLDSGDQAPLRAAMQRSLAAPQQVQTLWVRFDGKRCLLSVAYIPELRWHVLTALDLSAAEVADARWLWPVAIGVALLVAAMLLGFEFAIERLMLRPLRRLQLSAHAIADGRYDVSLPPAGQDEIGDLSRMFGIMAQKVRSHTAELEDKVRERTQALENANREMAAAQKKIGDSIDYASLIQRAILPDRQLVRSLGEHHFVLWKPRDVVGGDFYVFRADGPNCLLGVMDCAGHGVPGALMTMLARAAIDHAIAEVGPADPAAILTSTDAAIRAMLADAQLPRTLAINTDAGLAYVDWSNRTLRYAGAKISLYASDGQVLEELPGARRALGDKRQGDYANVELSLKPGWTYYLVTDGFLDQAGGEHGFGFGNRRFAELLTRHARQPLSEQAQAFSLALDAYRGERPQRDDITLLSFRFE